MKIKNSLFLIILLLTCVAAASPQSKSQVEAEAEITAADYCAFLNAVATTDTQNLYDEKMATDLTSAGVTRAGVPGSYVYEVLVGKENEAITFLSAEDAAQYCNWKSSISHLSSSISCVSAASTSTFNFDSSVDCQLTSNQLTFVITSAAHSNLAQQSSKPGSKDSTWEEIVGGASMLGIIMAGGENASDEDREQSANADGRLAISENPNEHEIIERARTVSADGYLNNGLQADLHTLNTLNELGAHARTAWGEEERPSTRRNVPVLRMKPVTKKEAVVSNENTPRNFLSFGWSSSSKVDYKISPANKETDPDVAFAAYENSKASSLNSARTAAISAPWFELTAQAREVYQETKQSITPSFISLSDIKAAEKILQEARLQEAQEKVIKAREKVQRKEKYWYASQDSKQRALDAARKAEEELLELVEETKLEEQRSSFFSEFNLLKQEAKKKAAVAETAKSKAMMASLTKEQEECSLKTDADLLESPSLLEEAILRAHEVETAWEEIMTLLQQAERKAPLELKEECLLTLGMAAKTKATWTAKAAALVKQRDVML